MANSFHPSSFVSERSEDSATRQERSAVLLSGKQKKKEEGDIIESKRALNGTDAYHPGATLILSPFFFSFSLDSLDVGGGGANG